MPSSQLRDRTTDTWPDPTAATTALGLIVPPLTGSQMAVPPPTHTLSTPIPQDPQTPCLHPTASHQGDTLGETDFKGTHCPALIPLQDRLTPYLKTHRLPGGLDYIGQLPPRQSHPEADSPFPSRRGQRVLSCFRGQFLLTGNRWADTPPSQYPQGDSASPPGRTLSYLCVYHGNTHFLPNTDS